MSAAAEALAERLRRRVDAAGDATRRVERLVLALADEIKATSNDQNVQRLSRELRLAAGGVAAIVATVGAD